MCIDELEDWRKAQQIGKDTSQATTKRSDDGGGTQKGVATDYGCSNEKATTEYSEYERRKELG